MLRQFRSGFLATAGFLLATAVWSVAVVGAPAGAVGADDAAAARDQAVVEALLRLPDDTLSKHPENRAAVLRYLSRQAGTHRYIEVARELGVLDQTEELTHFLTRIPMDTLAVDAARLLFKSGKLKVIAEALQAEPEQAAAAATALGYIPAAPVRALLEQIVADDKAPLQVRIAATGALSRSDPGQRFLLNQATQQGVPASLNFAFSEALLSSGDKKTREAAAKVLTPIATKGAELIPPVKELVSLRGNDARGKLVFNTVGTCSKCHKVGGQGKEVGPDLSEIGSKLSREDMYVAILNPNAAVSHNYETYSVLDADGQAFTGLLINRNEAGVTIRNSEGVDSTIAIEDIEELIQQPTSLMPADLQKMMSLENLVDLVDYMVLLRKPGEKGFNAVVDDGPVIDRRDPSTAVDGFEIAEGIQVELFASEPMLLSPTSIDVDSLGRVWVCEAVNYRHFRNPQNTERSEGDRILVLEDSDGDGQADKRTVFYQGRDIDSPHGVTVLGDRVIVSAGENVIVFTDADGDLKPESQEMLFTGIGGAQHDHGIHAFGIGPDGKLYFNFGNEGKQLKGPAGETIVDLAGNVVDDSGNPYQQGMVFRCNLDGSQLETLGWNFRNNWEVCVDSFGTLWQSDNDDDGNRGTRINFVMEFGNYGYRDELTHDTWRVQRTGLEDEIPLQHWHLNDPGVVPNILQTGAGSPTGICVYEGDLLPTPFRNQIIHTDPGPNVVRAYPVTADGAGYKASIRNLVQGVKDPWFRPVDVRAAPDGSLFIADWYDPGVGGHRMGDVNHGRIFRIVPTGHEGYRLPTYDYDDPSSAVEALMNPNLAVRFLAQQALEKQPAEAEAALVAFADGAAPRQLARALWQAARIAEPANRELYIGFALKHSEPDIRIAGIRVARQHGLDMIAIAQMLKNDPSSQVRRELAIGLRHNTAPQANALWVDLAVQHDGQDRWMIEALGIAADQQWDVLLDAWLARVGDNWNTPAGRDILWRCRSPKACKYLAEIIRQTPSAADQLRYFRAFDFHQGSQKEAALTELVSTAE